MSRKAFFHAGVSVLLLAAPAAQAQKPANPAPAKEAAADSEPLDESKVKLDPVPAKLPGAEAGTAAPEAAAAQAPAMAPGLEKLSPEKRAEVGKAINDVAAYMRGVRLQEALERLNDVEKAIGEFHIISNMRGAVYTKMRDFKTAREEFEKAVNETKLKDPEGFHPRFNLAEINFVEKKYDDARKGFEELIATLAAKPKKPNNEAEEANDKSTTTLMQFKLLICDVQQDKDPAEHMAKLDQYDNDSPAWYFANAAMAFKKDNKEEAEEWLASASKIYPKELNDIYQDSLVEVGWLQTLQ